MRKKWIFVIGGIIFVFLFLFSVNLYFKHLEKTIAKQLSQELINIDKCVNNCPYGLNNITQEYEFDKECRYRCASEFSQKVSEIENSYSRIVFSFLSFFYSYDFGSDLTSKLYEEQRICGDLKKNLNRSSEDGFLKYNKCVTGIGEKLYID